MKKTVIISLVMFPCSSTNKLKSSISSMASMAPGLAGVKHQLLSCFKPDLSSHVASISDLTTLAASSRHLMNTSTWPAGAPILKHTLQQKKSTSVNQFSDDSKIHVWGRTYTLSAALYLTLKADGLAGMAATPMVLGSRVAEVTVILLMR